MPPLRLSMPAGADQGVVGIDPVIVTVTVAVLLPVIV